MPVSLLVATLLFNLGQGVLRPAMPLYLQRSFAANYKMVTLIPVVFGMGKWVTSLPSGYLIDRLGRRPLMAFGLLLIAVIDILSVLTSDYRVFLGLRAIGGVGWAMFATVATTITVGVRAAERRGRAVSLLLMSETLGVLVGSTGGGWLYESTGVTIPFFVEAGCVVLAGTVIARAALSPADTERSASPSLLERQAVRAALQIPGVALMGLTNAVLMGIQTGVMVFLFPLFLINERNVGPAMVGAFVSLTVAGRLVALWLGGSVSDRWGRLPVLVPGLAAYAAVLGGLPVVTHPAALGLLSMAVGCAAGFVMALPTALVGDRVPPHLQGVAVGWLRTMTDTGHVVGPLVLGAVADAIHVTAPFVCVALLLALLAWRCQRLAAPEPAML